MWTENKNVRSVRTFVIIILGNILYALIVKLFLLPGNLMTGGTTGIGLLVKRYTEMSLAGFVLIFNLIMLAAGFVLLGKKFALTTVISSLAYPIFLEVFDRILGEVTLTEEPILNTIFSGLGIGLALGLVIRTGASTGGMDIPPLVLHKYFRIPVSVSLNFFDMLILAGQAVYNPAERILYGILLILIYTRVLDKVMMMGSTRTEVKIISGHVEEIRQAILAQVDRGVTILYGEGGYLQEETQVVLSILYNRELPKVERLIRDIDPEAFMIVSRVTEVRGKGFSISKDYR
ncbi:MAG: YitT family protein [Dorea sp.]|nr:YitT family protein [Dorea sp.]